MQGIFWIVNTQRYNETLLHICEVPVNPYLSFTKSGRSPLVGLLSETSYFILSAFKATLPLRVFSHLRCLVCLNHSLA